MSRLLSDGEQSSMRVVLNPEKMVVKGSATPTLPQPLWLQRRCRHLQPSFPHPVGQLLRHLENAQAQNLELVHECFQPLPIFEVPLFEQEVMGIPMLTQMANAVWAGKVRWQRRPDAALLRGKPQEILKNGSQYVLSLSLPLIERIFEVQLHRSVLTNWSFASATGSATLRCPPGWQNWRSAPNMSAIG
jgi:arsenite-transporting ATPase